MAQSVPPAQRGHLVVDGLTKRFGDFVALRSVSMAIQRGQVAVVVGGSGAGKTTLLKLMIGLEKPSGGAVYVDGTDIASLGDRALNKVRRKFGMVFQYAALLDSMTVFENVAFPLREHTKLRPKEIRERVAERLRSLEVGGLEDRFPSAISGGQRKRVALARALMLEPEILVYDEPTSGLDPITSRLVDDLILETNHRYNVTSVVISHDMASALRVADRIYLLSQGEIVTDGTPRELAEGNHRLARQFLESSGVSAEALLRQ